MPAEGTAVVAMEKSAALEEVRERPEEATATERAPSRAAAAGWTCAIRSESGARGSSPSASFKDFLATPVTVPVAMNASNERGGRHCNDFARMSAGAR